MDETTIDALPLGPATDEGAQDEGLIASLTGSGSNRRQRRQGGGGDGMCPSCGRNVAQDGPCAWCAWGKSAAVGGAVGGAAGLVLPGVDIGRGALYGALLAGLAAWWKGR